MKRFYNREKSKRIFVFQRITQSYTPLFTTTYYLLLCLNFVKKRQTNLYRERFWLIRLHLGSV